MLILSRQKDESIMIGDDVEIIIVDVRGNKVRLGIKAPKNIIVHRREIWEAIRRKRKKELQKGKEGEVKEKKEERKRKNKNPEL